MLRVLSLNGKNLCLGLLTLFTFVAIDVGVTLLFDGGIDGIIRDPYISFAWLSLPALPMHVTGITFLGVAFLWPFFFPRSGILSAASSLVFLPPILFCHWRVLSCGTDGAWYVLILSSYWLTSIVLFGFRAIVKRERAVHAVAAGGIAALCHKLEFFLGFVASFLSGYHSTLIAKVTGLRLPFEFDIAALAFMSIAWLVLSISREYAAK